MHHSITLRIFKALKWCVHLIWSFLTLFGTSFALLGFVRPWNGATSFFVHFWSLLIFICLFWVLLGGFWDLNIFKFWFFFTSQNGLSKPILHLLALLKFLILLNGANDIFGIFIPPWVHHFTSLSDLSLHFGAPKVFCTLFWCLAPFKIPKWCAQWISHHFTPVSVLRFQNGALHRNLPCFYKMTF